MNLSKVLTLCMTALLMVAYFFWEGNNEPTHNVIEKPPTEVVNPNWQGVVDYAREHLPMEGKLTVNSEGFGYLKVDDDYIRTLFPMLGLQNEGFRPPPYYRRTDSPGAHISVFYVNERIKPSELGQTFHFDLEKITIVKSRYSNFVVLQVNSPELENLRKKYGLSPKLFGHDFHISLGKKTIHKTHSR